MDSSLLMFLIADAVFVIASILVIVAAFRVRVLYGFLVIFLPLASLVFAIKYRKEAGARFVASVVGYIAMLFIVATSPELLSRHGLGERLPGAQLLADALGTKPLPARTRGSTERGDNLQAPREARDLAENGAPAAAPSAPPVADPHAAQRAALARHAAELNVLYAELNAARAKLKNGSSEVAAFNVKVAGYQYEVAALAAEQAQLEALDHPGAKQASATPPSAAAGDDPREAAAKAALARLRATAASADYAAFAGTLKTCLADYRGTTVFPQIAATARGTLANATPDKLAAAIQAQGTNARAERDTAMGKVRAIINQTPPTVPAPPRGAESYHYGFHPGALTPDYAHADLHSTRELWKGDYVYMDTAPGVYYRSADCEFNPQTKFFFTDRNKPKKKLTDAEITEVVRLYRLIAVDEQTLAAQPQRLRDAQAASAELLGLNKQLAAIR